MRLLTSSRLEQNTCLKINYQTHDGMIDTVSKGITKDVNVNGVESGMDHSLHAEYSMEESKDMWGQKS